MTLLDNPSDTWQEISIKDLGSMHGTHLANRRLGTDETEALWDGDVVTMGSDVTRGSCESPSTPDILHH